MKEERELAELRDGLTSANSGANLFLLSALTFLLIFHFLAPLSN